MTDKRTLAVDLVIRRSDEFLFIVRKFPPFEGKLALPGGFVEDGETVEEAACRELQEETGIQISTSRLQLVGVFSRPDRDPRGRVVSVAYFCKVPLRTVAKAGDDAANTVWLDYMEALRYGLAFDHAEILEAS